MFNSPIAMLDSHIWIEDVTSRPELRRIAQNICLGEYKRIYHGDSQRQETAEELWSEAKLVGTVPYLRTLMAFGMDGKAGRPLGTITFRIGSLYNGSGHVLDLMDYIHPACGWENYDSMGFDPRKTIEVSMFSFANELADPERMEERIRIFRDFHSHSLVLASQYGCDQFWSILARVFARFVKVHCKLPCIRADEMLLNEAKHGELFDRYSSYWRTGKPGLYKTEAPAMLFHDPWSSELVS